MNRKRFGLSTKILVIPVVGTLSLILSLTINTVTTDSNRVLLEDAELTQFPLLQISERNLVQLERIKETLSGAVTTGDEEMVVTADQMRLRLFDDLEKAKSIAPNLERDISIVQEEVELYTTTAERVTSEMISETADFSRLGETISEMNVQYDAALGSLTQFRNNRLTNFTTAIKDAKSNAVNAIYYGVAVSVVAMIVLFGTAVPISRAIVNSVNNVVSSLRDIAQEDGDLTVRLRQTSSDEVGDLVHWFNTFADKLQNVIGQIISTVDPLSDLAGTLNNFVSQTLDTVATQKGQAQSVMSSAGEINNSVESVSRYANSASENATETTEIARKGHRSILDTVKNIDELSEDISASAATITELDQTAKSVSLVVGVIKNIAEQTNLLALNAAIEAARAGEQGRGFAVVADEVRSLASKTQQSTDEIQGTIQALESGTERAVQMMQSSTEKTNECVTSVNDAGNRFQAIMENIDRNRRVNSEIASATDAQQQLSNLLQKHATEIGDGAEQSHDSTSKLATNISQLAELTQSLKSVADQFKV
tara:strand:- start:1588 stop:3204 length:1617 start_codon:yes stop_codon:yes gene_type:complete